MKHFYIFLFAVLSLSTNQVNAQNPTDCFCFELYDPVCGDNGITYSNYCYAACEGVEDYSMGGCAELTPIVVAAVGELFSHTFDLGPNESAWDGPTLSLLSSPDWADANVVAGNFSSSNSFGNWLLEVEGTPTISDLGVNYFVIGSTNPWTGDISITDTISVSVINNCICPAVAAPVCGVDGNTYGNSCEAACANVEVAYDGMCEEMSNCIADVEIIGQEIINGFAGPMLHIQVMNVGNDLENINASVELGICPSTDNFTFDAWAEGEVMDMYYNFACLSMAPYIEPYTAQLTISSPAVNCFDSFDFEFDPQGGNSTEGCTDADGTFYANGQEWNIDDCTFCSCMEGEIMCMVVDCAMPPCDNPVYIEGQCCPVCEEEGCTDPIAINFNPEATIDDGSCEYEPNLNYCNFMGGILEIGESMEVNGEVCTCDLVIFNEWGFNGGAQVFCVPVEEYGCTADNGDFYPIGTAIDGECETCICTESFLDVFPPAPPTWQCYEIADCGAACDLMDCPFGCIDGVCIELEEQCYDDAGTAYPVGAIMEGECETCICSPSLLTVFPPPPPSWYCEEIPDCGDPEDCACIALYDPVCGSDGITYVNACLAECEGITDFEEGECTPIDPEEYGCSSDNGAFYPIGSAIDGECETCICTLSMDAVFPPETYWECVEIADCEEVYGCTDPTAFNYNPDATVDDGSCVPVVEDGCYDDNGEMYSPGYVMEGECEICICDFFFGPTNGNEGNLFAWSCEEIADCEENEVYGCTNYMALNYNPEAVYDDGSCEFNQDCGDWSELVTINVAGEYPTNYTGWNLSGTYYAFGGGITQLCLWEGCYDFGMNSGLPEHWENTSVLITDSQGNELLNLENGHIGSASFAVNTQQECNEMVYYIPGCIDENALNFDPDANYNVGCEYDGCYLAGDVFIPYGEAITENCETCICNSPIILDNGMLSNPWVDCFEIADCGIEIYGCTDPMAINYNPEATMDDGSCIADCACNFDYTPVCGANGITYGNFCEAECFGITEYYNGECLPTSFCEEIEVIAETAYDDNGQSILEVTVFNNSVNGISYPQFNILTNFPYVTLSPLFENAYQIPAGDSTTNTYQITDGWDATVLVDASYYVSSMNQNAACVYPISFVYEPNSGTQGCFENGEFYPIGAVLEGECESCVCAASDATSPLEQPDWYCEPIPGCGGDNSCDGLSITSTNVNAEGILEVFLSNTSNNIFSYPQLNVIDENGQVLAHEETFYYGIGTESMHSLEILVPMSEWPANTMLQVNTNFGNEFACQMPISFEDPCNLIDCAPGFDCVNGDCVPTEPQEYGCNDDAGSFYAFGETMQQECNTCTCTPGFNPNAEGFWMCTMMPCEEECAEGETSYELVMNFNGMDSGSFTIHVGDETYSVSQPENGLTAIINFCAAPGECIEVYALQTWMGPPFTHSLYADGVLVSENEYQYNCNSEEIYGCTAPEAVNYNPEATIDDGSCVFTSGGCEFEGELYEFGSTVQMGCNTCFCQAGFNPNESGIWSCTEMACGGCTDPDAINYDEYADEDDGSCEYENSTCNGYDALLTLNMEAWAVEHTWELLISSGEVLYSGGPYQSYTVYEIALCLEENNSYVMSLLDDYGDGWNGGSFSISSADCELVAGGLEIGQNAQFEFETSCEESNGPGWTYLNTGTNHTLVLQEDMFTDLYGNPLEPGDWVGVFYESNGELHCGGYVIWEGSTTVIPAQGDDTTTEIQDGFTTGETFQWMVWDESENATLYVNASYASEGLDEFVANGISPITELIAAPLVSEQEVQLNAGWNLFSTYMSNNNMTVQDVFLPYENQTVIVKNNMGAAYLPEWDYDGIGEMVNGEGYQAKMTSNNNLLFEGDYLNPEDNPVTLSEGWNMIAYLRTEPAAAIHVFENIGDLVIVKNNVGMAYLPEYGFDGIGNMHPGQGYQVKVLSEQVLEYLANDQEYRQVSFNIKTELEHFNQPMNTGSNLSLVVTEHAWNNVNPSYGDEIAIIDPLGKIVGALPYQKGNLVIPVYGNDELNPQKDGLYDNEDYGLILWSKQQQIEFDLSTALSEGVQMYEQDQIHIIESIDYIEEVKSIHSVQLQPNPTNAHTQLNAVLEYDMQIQLNVINLIGEIVFSESEAHFKGSLQKNLNFDFLAPGSYLIQLKTSDDVVNKALIIQ